MFWGRTKYLLSLRSGRSIFVHCSYGRFSAGSRQFSADSRCFSADSRLLGSFSAKETAKMVPGWRKRWRDGPRGFKNHWKKETWGIPKGSQRQPKTPKKRGLSPNRFRMLPRVLAKEFFLPFWVRFGFIFEAKSSLKSMPKSMPIFIWFWRRFGIQNGAKM